MVSSFGAIHMNQHLNQYLYYKRKPCVLSLFLNLIVLPALCSNLFKLSNSLILSHFILLYSCTNFITSSFLLPFILFFTRVTNIHNYNTRLAAKQSYYLPFVRTNYGKFNIRFQGPSIWNSIDDHIKL